MSDTTTRPLALPELSHTMHPSGNYHAGDEIGQRMRRSRRRLDIMSTLATGHLPWGVAWNMWLTRSGNRWLMCCGHVLAFAEAQALVTAGLLTPNRATPAPNEDAKPDDLFITDAGRTWLQRNWHAPARPRRPAPKRSPIQSEADF